MTKPKPKERDPLLQLKYKGYCLAKTPPGDGTTLEDLVNYAKFALCKMSRRLWKDPIWDQYTDEEILIEYFANLFAKDEKVCKDFEVSIDSGTEIYGDDIYDWLDKKVAENQKEQEKKLSELPDRISFSPEQSIDKEE